MVYVDGSNQLCCRIKENRFSYMGHEGTMTQKLCDTRARVD